MILPCGRAREASPAPFGSLNQPLSHPVSCRCLCLPRLTLDAVHMCPQGAENLCLWLPEEDAHDDSCEHNLDARGEHSSPSSTSEITSATAREDHVDRLALLLLQKHGFSEYAPLLAASREIVPDLAALLELVLAMLHKVSGSQIPAGPLASALLSHYTEQGRDPPLLLLPAKQVRVSDFL